MFLLIGMIGMFSASTLAQERSTTVEIGTAEESTFRLPCTPGNWYSISEQIYTADEIANAGGGPGTITSISFYGYNSWTTSPGTRTWDVYLVNTTKSTFSSASDWVGVNASQKVFSGTISIIKNTWTTVPINNFTYEGGNLLVVVDDNSGSSTQSSGHGGYVFNTTSHQSNWAASSDDINPSNPNMTCTAWETKKNNIRFEFDLTPVSCPTPQNLVVSAVSSNSATLTWQAGGDETAWNVQYKTASSGSWSQSISVSSPTYTITNLTTNTDYQARVQAACSGEESGWKTVSFATECEAIELPYYYNFSDATTCSMPECWHRFNDATNSSYQGYPRVNADYHHNTSSPTRSLLFNYSSSIPNQIAILPVINVNDYPLDQYQVVFWVRSASNKKLQVGTMTDPNNASTFRQIGEITTSGSSTSWQEYTVRLDNNTYTEQEKYIAIKSPTTNATSAIYLDDIDVQLIPSCEKPYSLTKSDEYAHGATIAWTGGNDNWQIAYSTTSNFDPDDSNQCTYLDAPSNPYTITGLAPQTTYYIRVRSNCGDNNYSYWNTTPTNFNFTTTIACPAPTDLRCTSITKNSATLEWTKGDESQNDFTVAYSTTSEFDPETATQRQANSNSMILTGLTEGTTYYAKVRANCGGDDGSSNWSNQCSFKPSSGGELEVNQGTNTNSYVPVYGNQVQNTTQSQFIIPSTSLSDIAGCVISKITFHYSNNLETIDWGEAEFEVYVKEVDETAFASNATFNWDGLIKVYTGKLSPSNKTMEIEFDTPYEYQGGNLKIGVKQTKSGSKKSCSWLGISTDYISSLGGYNTYVYRPKFLPWTTITYTTSAAPVFTKDIDAYTEGSKDHYYLIASPIGAVSPEEVTNMLEYSYDLYYFDQAATDGKEWINYRNDANVGGGFNLQPGKGYLYANSEDVTLTFTGAPYNETGQVDLAYDANATLKGWNLIGNPYSTIATLDKAYYRLNQDGNALSATTENDAVEVMEGVFVQATEAGQTANFAAITTTNGETDKVAKLNINLTQSRDASTGSATTSTGSATTLDNAIIRFDNGSMLGKFQLNPNKTKVYIPQGDKDYAIVRSAAQGEMPVNFKAEKNGSYTLNVSAENMGIHYLHLIDNMTGADVDLLSDPNYNFEAKTTDYASRFRLVFKADDNGASTSSATFAYYNGNNWVISNPATDSGSEATLQVIDIMGRILRSETLNGNAEISLDQPAGIYMLRLVNSNDVKVQKVVVR